MFHRPRRADPLLQLPEERQRLIDVRALGRVVHVGDRLGRAFEKRAIGVQLEQAESLAALDDDGHAPAQALDASLEHSKPYPVAVKALSSAIPHKTDVGGVVIDVASAGELRDAVARIRASTGAERFLVQRMASGVGEALIGYRVDPQVGPIVMLAAGGVLAEVHRDSSIRLAPVDLEEMMREAVGEVVKVGEINVREG